MAFLQLSFPSGICCFSTRKQFLPSSYPNKMCVFSKLVDTTVVGGKFSDQSSNIIRRSANYQPPIWKHEFLQSLTCPFMDETYISKIDTLTKAVKVILLEKLDEEEADPSELFEIIDSLQRLGISYPFENDIKQILDSMKLQRLHGIENMRWKNKSLYATALEFRVLRQHGYFIPQDVFIGFKDEMENLSACDSEEKAKGMLALYEASFLAMEGESLLDEARNLAVKHLENYIKYSSNNEGIVSAMIKHALELPLHWRMPRLEARWFIDIYEKRFDMNPILLEFARLDFNLVQSKHQEDLKYVSRWWRSTGLGEKLEFARDRVMSNFFWSVGLGFEPKLEYCRRMSTKIGSLITTIDDVYDVYATLDELELFTLAVERWDIDGIDMLPNYMKICFLALHNTINDMTFDILKDQGVNVIQYLKKMWADLCKAFLIEARWYHTNHKPTFKEYLDNAWISVSGSLILFHAYVFSIRPLAVEDLESLKHYSGILRYSSMIFRLTNDLASSSDEVKRGDVLKSVQCYMSETGATEDEAKRYIKNLIIESWKKLNEIRVTNSSYPSTFIEIAFNLGRISHTTYQHRDGHTIEDHETRDRVLSLFLESI